MFPIKFPKFPVFTFEFKMDKLLPAPWKPLPLPAWMRNREQPKAQPVPLNPLQITLMNQFTYTDSSMPGPFPTVPVPTKYWGEVKTHTRRPASDISYKNMVFGITPRANPPAKPPRKTPTKKAEIR
jgi:hypothetical protein